MRSTFLLALLGFILSFTTLAEGSSHFLGKTYISLNDVAKRLNLDIQAVTHSQSVTLSKPSICLLFSAHRNEFTFNGHVIYLGWPVASHKGKFWITQQDFHHTLLPILQPQRFAGKHNTLHIMIDPGHGGKDTGTQNKALKLIEKKLSLDLSARLAKILQKQGFKVSLTRYCDTFIDLYERSKKANKAKADLFISLHFNAVASNQNNIFGIETYILPPQNQPSTGRSTLQANDKENYPGNKYNASNAILGYHIQSSLCTTLNVPDRGLKKARFAVLKDLNCPGILIECGFLSHLQEAQMIRDPLYRDKIAQAIAKGIIHYQKVITKK